MTKRLFFVLGVVIGIVLAEIFRRKKMERLHELEEKQKREKARFAKYERQWQKELASMPFDDRMDYEFWSATMKLDDWIPSDYDEDEEDDDATQTD